MKDGSLLGVEPKEGGAKLTGPTGLIIGTDNKSAPAPAVVEKPKNINPVPATANPKTATPGVSEAKPGGPGSK
jgi:hypothetical protein